MVLEIRTYRVRDGAVDAFVALMREAALPLLRAAEVDVVACAASLEPGDGDPRDAYLIRAFSDEAARHAAEREFYGGAAWREGPREEILRRIESFHTVVLEVSPSAVEALRR
jgi:hypothetical protein